MKWGSLVGSMSRLDPYAKKDWYDIKAPSVFEVRNVGKTLVSRTQGTKVWSPFLYLLIFKIFFSLFSLLVCGVSVLISQFVYFVCLVDTSDYTF